MVWDFELLCGGSAEVALLYRRLLLCYWPFGVLSSSSSGVVIVNGYVHPVSVLEGIILTGVSKGSCILLQGLAWSCHR